MAVYNDFSSQLGQGLRPSDYEVSIGEIFGIASVIGANIPQDEVTRAMVLCKTASQPASAIEKVEIMNRGLKHNLSGQRVYDDYTLGFWNDPKLVLKTFFEAWMDANAYHDAEGHLILNGFDTEIKLIQYDTNHNPVCGYILYNAWPISVDAIETASEDTQTIQEYTVTFTYSRHKYVPLTGIKDIMSNINKAFDSLSKATLL